MPSTSLNYAEELLRLAMVAEIDPVKLPVPTGMLGGEECMFWVDPVLDRHSIAQALCGFAFWVGQHWGT